MPSLTGSLFNANVNNITSSSRRRLRDLIVPIDSRGEPEPGGSFLRQGASTIYREQGKRLIAIKFSVRDRDLAGAVREAQEKVAPLLAAPYRAEWSGEFQEMQEAEERLLLLVSLSLALILLLLYLAFRSLLDAAVFLASVLAMSLGGFWTLLLTGVNFNISAGVGFVSILGLAVMEGLLMVSYFNHLRAGIFPRRIDPGRHGQAHPPGNDDALAAFFGLLPAALSTRVGAQSQRPLALVVVGGMIMTLMLMNLVPLYSFYGQRELPAAASDMAH